MAAVNLPDNPANGTTSTVNGITYTYNSSKGYWTAASSGGGGGGGGASVSTSDAAPGSASDGDLWYDTDDGGMFVYYQDTDSSQWVEVIGSQGAAGPAGAAGADGGAGVASVYATVNALPTSGNTQGDMAHVTANNTLYFWNGSGWYKIALINTNPSISGVASAYALAIDGTATTVTMTATDPEGLPITYSIVSDTSGNIASVSQGTGASTNVFTITPSTNTAYAGSFTLTFRASDGVNIATAPATFTLQFSVENQRYTSSLFTSVGANNAVNTSFDDKSTSDHTITANGNVTQTTFSPYRHGGYSVKFDGSGDNLGFASLSALNVNTYMSLECWVKLGANGSYLIVGRDAGYWLMYNQTGLGGASNKFAFGTYAGGSWQAVSSTTSPDVGTWYHVVGVRDNASFKIYVNGTLENTATISGSPSSGGVVGIGANTNQLGGSLNGYLADVRVVISANSSSLPYTSNFTPSTDRLTAITDTQLLACHLPYMQEGSTHGHTITMNGNVAVVPAGPHDKQEYSASSHGGSAYLDGNGDGLTVTTNDFQFSGEFTFEAWVYWNGNVPSDWPMIFDTRPANSGNANALAMNIHLSNHRLNFYIGSTNYYWGTTALPANQWVHTAVVRDSNNDIKIYQNGVQGSDTVNSSATLSAAAALRIGYNVGNIGWWPGNITQFRVSDTARYTSTFTPPTSPFTSDSNTKFLMAGTDAGIIDKGQSARDLTLFGNTKSSTTQNKFLTSSIYLDGNGDYLKWTNNEAIDWGIGGEPFTLEWWQWWPSIVNERSLGPQTGGGAAGWNGTNGHQWTMFTYSGSANLFMQWWNGSGRTDYEFSHGGALTASTWQHFVVVYDGTNLSLYIDGSRITHRTSGNTFGTVTNRHGILGGNASYGGQSEIYYSDARITKGLARYSGTSLTVPTAALQG